MGIERRYRWKKRICRSTVVPGSGRSGQTGNGTYVTVSGTTLGPLRAPSTTLNTISRFYILRLHARITTTGSRRFDTPPPSRCTD